MEKKEIKRKIRKIFKRDNIVKGVMLFMAIILIMGSVLPYLF